MNTKNSPVERAANWLRVRPCPKASGAMVSQRTPRARTSSTEPSVEPESTTITSNGHGVRCACTAARTSPNRAPPFFTGISTEARIGVMFVARGAVLSRELIPAPSPLGQLTKIGYGESGKTNPALYCGALGHLPCLPGGPTDLLLLWQAFHQLLLIFSRFFQRLFRK